MTTHAILACHMISLQPPGENRVVWSIVLKKIGSAEKIYFSWWTNIHTIFNILCIIKINTLTYGKLHIILKAFQFKIKNRNIETCSPFLISSVRPWMTHQTSSFHLKRSAYFSQVLSKKVKTHI